MWLIIKVANCKDFVKRHRNKLVIGGLFFAGCVALNRYAQARLKYWHDKGALEYLEQSRRLHHFESISRTCNQTITSLIITLSNDVVRRFNTEELIEQLQSNSQNKLQLWNDLKVQVFSKISFVVYSTVILVITLKVQLSIIGGYLYKDPNLIPASGQEKYLSSCYQKLLNTGLDELEETIGGQCKEVLKTIDLKNQLRLCDLEKLLQDIRNTLESRESCPIQNLQQYIIPETRSVSIDTPEWALLDTMDLLSSDEVKLLATHLISASYITLIEHISPFFTSGMPQLGDGSPADLRKPVAKLLPILNGLASSKIFLDQILNLLLNNQQLQTLAANIYESFL